jgi:hypothetical protein
MHCEESRKMLYLCREGELLPAEERALANHLMVCESCAKEKAAADRAASFVRGLDRLNLTPEDPEGLTLRILQETSRRTSAHRRTIAIPMIDRMLDFFFAPAFRLASTGFIVLAVVSFLFQWSAILHDVYNLEIRQDQHDLSCCVPHLEYTVDVRPLRGTPEGDLLDRVDGGGTGGILVVNERRASSWKANGRALSRGFAKGPLSRGDAETVSGLVTYLRGNAHAQISFSKEGV